MLYRLTPTLIEKGKVYIAESPLFEITQKAQRKEKTWFAYSEKEKSEIIAKIGSDSYSLQRSKGLGENEPEMMWQTTMNPETRRLIQVIPDDAKITFEIFDKMLGDNLEGRKQYIQENGHRFLEMLDIG